MTTHCSVLWLTPRSRWIDGSATFTMAMSRTTMNWAAHDSARTTPLVLVRVAVATLPPSRLQYDELTPPNRQHKLLERSLLVFNKCACVVQGTLGMMGRRVAA